MRRALILLAAAVTVSSIGTPPAIGQTVTELLRSGANGTKLNLVVIGDGFTAANQAAFNNFVTNTIIQGLFNEVSSDVYRETMNAFNIFRVNADSAQSGVTTVDANGNVTNTVNTFLGYRFSGMWNRCWMEPGPNTTATLNATLNNLVPGWNFAFIILNTASFGGCRRGNTLAVTMGTNWPVSAHEMGHLVGNLGDEYTGANAYTGVEPGTVNLTIDTNRNTLKWRQFVSPATAIPTPTAGFAGDPVEDAGLFVGATIGNQGFNAGIFRPVLNGRMNSNTPAFGPIGYDQMQRATDTRHDYLYRNLYVGRFNADDRDDLMLHNANSIALYTGDADRLDTPWVRTLPDPVWDAYRPGDRFFIGDFDGDRLDDLFVFNASDWAVPYFAMLRATGAGFEGVRRFDLELPGWDDMKPNDQFFVADFNGDGMDDIVVLNTEDWSVGYMLMLRSTGNDLVYVRRFDEELPGWDDMRRHDRLYVADFDQDKRDDLFVFNGPDWSVGYLGMLRSTGNDYTMVRRFDEELPGWDDMKPNDQFFVADFDGDRRKDLYIFNGHDWSMSYLEMLRSTGTDMTAVRRFDGTLPGWDEMRRNDRWFVADVDGDQLDDLYVYNAADWVTEYLGTFRSTGGNLTGGWQDDWIGSWNLGAGDQFRVANFNGGAGWDDLLSSNDDWLGLLRSHAGSSTLSAIYPNWIHNHNFHNFGWW